MDTETHRRLGSLVDELTTSGSVLLEPKRLQELKNICRLSDNYVQALFAILMIQLSKQHSQIRLSAFQIVRELFSRSHSFRELLTGDLQTFLDRTVGTDPKKPLPLPENAAMTLKKQSLEAIQQWNTKYGHQYKKLTIGYRYLKDAKKIDLDVVNAELSARQIREDARKERRLAAIRQKVQIIVKEKKDLTPEIEHCLREMNSCFELLLPKPESFFARTENTCPPTEAEEEHLTENEEECSGEVDGEESEGNSSDEGSSGSDDRNTDDLGFLQNHGLVPKGFSLSLAAFETGNKVDVQETEDTAPVIASLKDNYKLIVQKFLPTVTQWLKIVGKCDDQGKLKEVLDVKDLLAEAKTRYEMFDFSSKLIDQPIGNENESDDTDEDDLEEVPEKEGLEESIIEDGQLNRAIRESLAGSSTSTIPAKPSAKFNMADDPTSSAAQIRAIVSRLKPAAIATATAMALSQTPESTVSDPRKAELLRKAPVVAYGLDLHYSWDNPGVCAGSDDRHSSAREHYWSNQDIAADETVARQAAESRADGLKNRVIDFSGTFEPVTRMCRAPLPNGKLCPRKDKYKCPFHGIIVHRDEAGAPAEGKSDDANVGGNGRNGNEETTWEDIEEEVLAGAGLTLVARNKRKRKGKSRGGSGGKSSTCGPGLINLRAKEDTSRSRLENKMFSGMRRVAKAMDAADHRRNEERFGHQWTYSLRK
eukprot:m.3478 g.3478  ORF g.3478 m.3478 type:complete len:706 (+) comp9457_c0_seq1:14-2131(+)